MPVLNAAIEHYNNILNSFSSDTSFMDLTDIYTLFGFNRVENLFEKLDIYSKTQLQLNILENINYEDILKSNDNSKLYALINQIPFTISSTNVDLYQNFDISNMSESELNDRGLMYEYIINNSSFLELEANYINNDTGIKLQTLRDIPTVIFGSNDETKNETIYTQKTDDRVYAGKGSDTIIAWGGNNLYDGGEGNDTISYKNIINSNKEGVTLTLSLATAQAINSTTTDTLVSIENVIGSKYSDTIYGSSFDDTTLKGEKKTHIIEGYKGRDEIYGDTKENPFESSGIFNFFNSNRDEYGNIIEYDDKLYGAQTTDEELLSSGNLAENHLYGGDGFDSYSIKDYVTIEDVLEFEKLIA